MHHLTMNKSTLSAAFIASAVGMASPAYAIDSGCYPADVVRNATWLNLDPQEKQYTIIKGQRTTDAHNDDFITSNLDGSVGYYIENNGTRPDNGQLCIVEKYIDVHVNTSPDRPIWVNPPSGSPNDNYLGVQEQRSKARIIFGAKSVVREKNGQESVSSQILLTHSNLTIDGSRISAGSLFTNTRSGTGEILAAIYNLQTNSNFEALLTAQYR